MFRRLLQRAQPRSVYDVMAAIACFGVLAGGTAYAANTISSTDIIDGQVKSVDVGDAELKSADVKDESLTTFDVSTFLGTDVVDGTLTGADIQNDSLGINDLGEASVGPNEVLNDSLLQSDIRSGAITNDEVLDNSLISADITDDSLTGTDVNESTLSMPPTTTATFNTVGEVLLSDSFTKVAARNLPAGSWAVSATANTASVGIINNSGITDTGCELRGPNNGILGGTRSRQFRPAGDFITRSLSMNGGAGVPANGEISLWCRAQDAREKVTDAQMMFIRTDGFF
jgi:hypothetical protein